MVNISEQALGLLRAYFEGKELSPLRVYLAGGCGGPHLSLILDTQTEQDEAVMLHEFTFLVDKALLAEAQPISIDVNPMGGFEIESRLELDNSGGCGACGACG